jgi:hypothetical protein
MDVGHVDRITRRSISGWAADSDDLDRPVDVTILVDGERAAHVVCDRLREDLRARGTYGNGLHGFLHEFSPPLPEGAEAKIAVRFAESGQPVWNGDAVLPRGSGDAVMLPPPPQAPMLPAPTSPAMLFRLLGLLDPRQGLYPLLYRLDFSGVRRAHLDYSVLGAAEDAPRPAQWTPRIARDHLADLLHAPRFRGDILAHVLRAFPEKRRLFFLHIPKCAGSDLAAHLALRYPSVRQQWQEEAWFGTGALFAALADFVRELPFSDSILTAGHVRFDLHIGAGLVRPMDRIFTVVRDPIEIAISSVNYLLTRFQANLGARQPDADVQDWLATLGLPALPPQLAPPFVAEVIHRALYNPVVVQPNSICYWLGGGDAEAVIARLARHHVEITNTRHYDDWLAREWGVATPTRANASTRFLSLSDLSHQDLEHVRNLSPEDRKLYDLIEERLEASGRSSIFGEDLL